MAYELKKGKYKINKKCIMEVILELSSCENISLESKDQEKYWKIDYFDKTLYGRSSTNNNRLPLNFIAGRHVYPKSLRCKDTNKRRRL